MNIEALVAVILFVALVWACTCCYYARKSRELIQELSSIINRHKELDKKAGCENDRLAHKLDEVEQIAIQLMHRLDKVLPGWQMDE